MTTDQQLQGDVVNNIQCKDVSSTSSLPSILFNPKFKIKGRISYRNFHERSPIDFIHTHSEALSKSIPSYADKRTDEIISTRKALVSVLCIFLGSLFLLTLVYSTFPNVTEEEKVHLKVPFNIEDAKKLGLVLNRYKVDHYYQVMLGVFLIYILITNSAGNQADIYLQYTGLQTFAIPGSLFLSILSGFLFPFHEALLLICICSALGASLCFLLSQLLGRKLVTKLCPKKAEEWAVQINQHKDNLLNYIIFLRMTPILPNWFINLTAPILGVPLVPFALGTFIGVAPPSFFAIQGGRTLQDLTSTHNPLSLNSVGLLFLFGIISLIPVFLKKKLKNKQN